MLDMIDLSVSEYTLTLLFQELFCLGVLEICFLFHC